MQNNLNIYRNQPEPESIEQCKIDGNDTLVEKFEDTLKNLRVVSSYPSVLERYYKHVIHPHNYEKGKNEDLLVHTHSNRISLVTLAPTHDILRLNKKILSVDFNVSKKINRLDNQVKGKSKKGAQQVYPESILCSINCHDGTTYRIPACIKGKIIEINKRLVDEPSLISEKPFTDGYIAIILPPFQNKNE